MNLPSPRRAAFVSSLPLACPALVNSQNYAQWRLELGQPAMVGVDHASSRFAWRGTWFGFLVLVPSSFCLIHCWWCGFEPATAFPRTPALLARWPSQLHIPSCQTTLCVCVSCWMTGFWLSGGIGFRQRPPSHPLLLGFGFLNLPIWFPSTALPRLSSADPTSSPAQCVSQVS